MGPELHFKGGLLKHMGCRRQSFCMSRMWECERTGYCSRWLERWVMNCIYWWGLGWQLLILKVVPHIIIAWASVISLSGLRPWLSQCWPEAISTVHGSTTSNVAWGNWHQTTWRDVGSCYPFLVNWFLLIGFLTNDNSNMTPYGRNSVFGYVTWTADAGP